MLYDFVINCTREDKFLEGKVDHLFYICVLLSYVYKVYRYIFSVNLDLIVSKNWTPGTPTKIPPDPCGNLVCVLKEVYTLKDRRESSHKELVYTKTGGLDKLLRIYVKTNRADSLTMTEDHPSSPVLTTTCKILRTLSVGDVDVI